MLLDGREPEPRTALLVGLLRPNDMVAKLVPRDRRKEAKRRAEAIADSGLVGDAVKDAVEGVQAAVLAATLAATTAATGRERQLTGAPVVVLAGGTGGAKLARGMLDVAGEDLVVIANTGDDVEIYGAHVSPDPDLVTFWLADRIDERGWGLAATPSQVMDGLRELGVDVWFNLGDRDLAIGLERARRLAEGARLTEALDELTRRSACAARVLPMCRRAGAHARARATARWHRSRSS